MGMCGVEGEVGWVSKGMEGRLVEGMERIGEGLVGLVKREIGR